MAEGRDRKEDEAAGLFKPRQQEDALGRGEHDYQIF
jgi:hypothetical protein